MNAGAHPKLSGGIVGPSQTVISSHLDQATIATATAGFLLKQRREQRTHVPELAGEARILGDAAQSLVQSSLAQDRKSH